MAIRSKGVNARDKAFTDAYNSAVQRGDLDYQGLLDTATSRGYADIFVQEYNKLTEEDREYMKLLGYGNKSQEEQYLTKLYYMTKDYLDDVDEKEYDIVRYDENGKAVVDEKGDFVEEKRTMTDKQYAELMLERMHEAGKDRFVQDMILKQQEEYKKHMSFVEKLSANVLASEDRLLYGFTEGIVGFVDFIGSIGYGLAVRIGEGRDGYREYYEKHALSKSLQEGWDISLAEYERLYTDYRDVLTGDYTTLGKYVQGSIQTIGNMLPTIILGYLCPPLATGKIGNRIRTAIYYTSMFGTSQSATINDPEMAGVSTLAIIFNGAIKTAVEVAIEKLLAKGLGRVTGLDKALGTNSARAVTKGVNKMAAKGATTKAASMLSKFGKVSGKFLLDAAQEAAEEGLQEISGLLIDAMFDSKGETFFKGGFNWESVLDALIIGAIVSGGMSTVQYLGSPKVGTGDMVYTKDKKGNMVLKETKLTRVDSAIYRSNIETLRASYDELISKKDSDVDTTAFWTAQAFQTYSSLMSVFTGIGEVRTAEALKLLNELKTVNDKSKFVRSAKYIKTLIDSAGGARIANKEVTSSKDFQDKLRDAKVTQLSEVTPDNLSDMSPAWSKILQERWKENPDFKLMESNGTDIVVSEDSKVILVPREWFNQEALSVFKNVAEREVVQSLKSQMTLYENALLNQITKEYREWSGDYNASTDKALYSLLYNPSFYSVFMYANWSNKKAWGIFSRLNDMGKDILAEGSISKTMSKLVLKKIEKSMRKTLFDIARSTNVAYDNITVFTEAEKKEIRRSDLRARGTLVRNFKGLKQEASLELGSTAYTRINNNHKLPKETRSYLKQAVNIINNVNSTRMEVLDALIYIQYEMPSLLESVNYYISMFTGSYLNDTTLPKDIVDIVSKDSPISADGKLRPIASKTKQSEILDMIHNIKNQDSTQKYNASFGKDGLLYVYENIAVSEVFPQELIDDPYSFIFGKLIEKGSTTTVYDLIKENFESSTGRKLTANQKRLLKYVEIYTDIPADADYDGGYNSLTHTLHLKSPFGAQVLSRKKILFTLIHEVNHIMRDTSLIERKSAVLDEKTITASLREYIDKNFRLSSKLDVENIHEYIAYAADEKELAANNIKQIALIGRDGSVRLHTNQGFIITEDRVIAPTYTTDDKPIEFEYSTDQKKAMKKAMSLIEKANDKLFLKQEATKITKKEIGYMAELKKRQEKAIVDKVYDAEFRNKVHRSVKDIVSVTVPTIYRSTATINDVVANPEKYLDDKTKKLIIDNYGSLSSNNVMKFLQKYFNTKFKGTVDLSFRAGSTKEVAFINVKSFSEYQSDILASATYDGEHNGLTRMVANNVIETESGRKIKGKMPVSMLVSKEHNFGLISTAYVVISDKEGPSYHDGVITLNSPKSNNDFRYQFAHEFQHLLDHANNMSGGTSMKFQVTSNMIKELRENVPGYLPDGADNNTLIRLTREYVYHLSGERKAYGFSLFDADFVHIERRGRYHRAHMPWGGVWEMHADVQQGRASVIINATRKSIPIKQAREHFIMINYLKKGGKVSDAMTIAMQNFIFELTPETLAKLDEPLQLVLKSGKLSTEALLEYIRTTDYKEMNNYTFSMINKHFFGNTYFNTFSDVDVFLNSLDVWHALYYTMLPVKGLEQFMDEEITNEKVKKLVEKVQSDPQLKLKYEKYRVDYYKNSADAVDNSGSIRLSALAHMKGTLKDTLRMAAIQKITNKKIHSRGDVDMDAVMVKRELKGEKSALSRKTFSERVESADVGLSDKSSVAEILAAISPSSKADTIADYYKSDELYDIWMSKTQAELDAEYLNVMTAMQTGLKEDQVDFNSKDTSDFAADEQTLVSAIELLGKRLWRATTGDVTSRKKSGYKFDLKNKSLDIDWDTIKKEGRFNLETLKLMRDDIAYKLRLAEQRVIQRKGSTKLKYKGILGVYSRDVQIPDSLLRLMEDKSGMYSETDVQGTKSVTYEVKRYRGLIARNSVLFHNILTIPGEAERIIEFMAADPAMTMTGAERERFKNYAVMVMAWIKNAIVEKSLAMDSYHIDLLDKAYNQTGHDWGTLGAALRTAVTFVSPTAYMMEALADIAGVKLKEEDVVPLVKAMKSNDANRVAAEMKLLEQKIYESGGDNKMSVLDMFFAIRSDFMLSNPGTWLRNISSNIILRGSMRASSYVAEGLVNRIFKKTKGLTKKYDQWQIEGTTPTKTAIDYRTSILNSDIYALIQDGLNKYQYDEAKGPYKKDQKDQIKYDSEGKPIENLNNNIYANMIVEAIKRRFYGATSYEYSMAQTKGLSKAKVLGKMMDKAHNALKKVMSDEKYIKARASYYFDRMLTEAVAKGDISNADLQPGKLNEKVAIILAQAFTNASADYMHKGSFLKDIESILYKAAYNEKSSTTKRMGMKLAYSVWKILLPYANAGFNWFAAGLAYSPLGFVTAVPKLMHLEQDMMKDPNNKMVAYYAKQGFGKAVIGTVLWGIGYALVQMGIVGYDDEDEVIVIGDMTFDIKALFGSPALLSGMILASDLDLLEKFNKLFQRNMDGLFLTDFIDSLSYVRGGSTGFLTATAENMLQSMIPNIWKQFTRMTTNYKAKTVFGPAGIFDRFFANLIPGWSDKNLVSYISPYTGEKIARWDYPVWSRISSFLPFKIGSRKMSEVEKFSLEYGNPKIQISGKYDDQQSGTWSYKDVQGLNEYYGQLNNLAITEFMSNNKAYTIVRNGKNVTVKFSQMTPEEVSRVLARIYTENSTISKIWAWTNLGNKYYATDTMYLKLKQLGINNVFRKIGKYDGFVEK